MNELNLSINNLDNNVRQLLEINASLGTINSQPNDFYLDSSFKLQSMGEKEIDRKNPSEVLATIERLAREILASDPSKISKSQWIKILENARMFSKDNPICDTDMFIKSTVEPIFNSIYVKRDGHCVVEILRKDPKDITLEELNFSESFLY